MQQRRVLSSKCKYSAEQNNYCVLHRENTLNTVVSHLDVSEKTLFNYMMYGVGVT